MPKKNKYPWYEARKCYRKQIKMPDGAYKTLYAKTEGEMDEKVRHVKEEIDFGIASDDNPYVVQYAKKWFGLNSPGLSPARVRDYRNAINIYIMPTLAGKRMREVTLDDGKLILASIAGRSRSLQGNVVFVLKRMFEDAEESHVIIRSPFLKLKAGGKLADEKTPLADAQVEVLLNATQGTRVYPFIMIALYSGMRREEILGLRWENVHLDTTAPYIAVRERVTTLNDGSPLHETALKSKAARRNIPIPRQLFDMLSSMEHTSEFVVPSASGKPQSKSAFNSMWRSVTCRMSKGDIAPGSSPENHPDVIRSIDFHVSPHILRHTYITNLCRSGLNLKIIQYLAGHAKAQMTLGIYIHATENRPEDLSEIINFAFEKRAEKDTKADTNIIDIREAVVAQ